MNPHAFARGTTYPRPQIGQVGLGKFMFFLWLIVDKLKRIFMGYILWYLFDLKAVIGQNCLISKGSYISNTGNKENIVLGDHVVCKGMLSSEYKGKINIGSYVFIGDNTILSAYDEITIGDNVLISHSVNIFDNDSHSMDDSARASHFKSILDGTRYQVAKNSINSAKIVIEDNVWIGFNSVILKGIKIGRGAIIACGSVVTKDVEPWTVVAGNPARIVKRLKKKDWQVKSINE